MNARISEPVRFRCSFRPINGSAPSRMAEFARYAWDSDWALKVDGHEVAHYCKVTCSNVFEYRQHPDSELVVCGIGSCHPM